MKRIEVFIYFLQYIIHIYKISVFFIKQIVILMCSKNCEPQRWIVTGDEFDQWTGVWWDRVHKFYAESS